MGAKLTQKDFIQRSLAVHNSKYDYSKSIYISSHSKLIIICSKHGDFQQIPSNHWAGKGCNKCAYDLAKYSTKEFIEKAKKIHNCIYDYSNVIYIGSLHKINIKCLTHGDFSKWPSAHLEGFGCPKCANGTMTLEDFINKANSIHNYKYTYLNTTYSLLNTKVKITCADHGDFNQTPKMHLSGQGCNSCGQNIKKTSLVDFLDRANKFHDYKYDYSLINYINSYTKIKIKCHKHGFFEQNPGDHLTGGCIKCGTEKKAQALSYTTEEFISLAKEIHNDRYDYNLTNYITMDYNIKITCKEHGVFEQNPRCHISGQNCRKCFEKSITLTTEEFITQCKEKHGDKYDYSLVNYKNNSTKVKIICSTHGVFEQKPGAHKKGVDCSECYKIRDRRRSKVAGKWLDTLSISDEYREFKLTTKTYDGYIADGFDVNTNTVFEFYGDIWHGNPYTLNPEDFNKINKNKFSYLYRRTIEREDVLLQNGYNVAYIWESDFKAGKPFTLRSSHNKLDQYKGIK